MSWKRAAGKFCNCRRFVAGPAMRKKGRLGSNGGKSAKTKKSGLSPAKIHAGKFCKCRNGPAAGGVRGRMDVRRKTGTAGGACARDNTGSRGSREVAPRQRRPGSVVDRKPACKALHEACGEKPYATLASRLQERDLCGGVTDWTGFVCNRDNFDLLVGRRPRLPAAGSRRYCPP